MKDDDRDDIKKMMEDDQEIIIDTRLIDQPACKGTFHLRFSGIRPLRGGGTPLFR